MALTLALIGIKGPCHFVDGSSEPSLNEYSWNTYANMLYVDQPIGKFGSDSGGWPTLIFETRHRILVWHGQCHELYHGRGVCLEILAKFLRSFPCKKFPLALLCVLKTRMPQTYKAWHETCDRCPKRTIYNFSGQLLTFTRIGVRFVFIPGLTFTELELGCPFLAPKAMSSCLLGVWI